MKTTVILDFEIEGFHRYPNPPKEVLFLQYLHRHLFQIRVGFKVDDLNREKEIFIEERKIKKYLYSVFGSPCNFDNMSCEHIAVNILHFIQDQGGVWVEVFEDSKGGAKVEL